MKRLSRLLFACALALGLVPLALASLTRVNETPTQVNADSVSYIDFAIKENSEVYFPQGNAGFQRVNLSAGKPTFLPDLIRTDSLDYEFDGWYDGETKVTTSTVFSEYTVVYDRWISNVYDTDKIVSSVSLSPAVPTAGMSQSDYQSACGEISQSGLWVAEDYKLYEGLHAKSGNEVVGTVEANKSYSAKIVLGVDYAAGYRIGKGFMNLASTAYGLISSISYIDSSAASSDTWSTDIRRVCLVINFTYNDFTSYPTSQYAENGKEVHAKFATTYPFTRAVLLHKTGFMTWTDLYEIKASGTSGEFILPALADTTEEFRIHADFPGNTSIDGSSFTIVYGSGASDADGKFLVEPPDSVDLALDESYVVPYLFNREFSNMWIDRWKDGYWAEKVQFHNNGVTTINGYDFANSLTLRIAIAYSYKGEDKIAYSHNFTLNWVDSATSWTVTFDGTTGGGSMAPIEDVAGDFVLPDCGFTAPSGKVFDQWLCAGVRYNPGDHANIDRASTFYALWKSVIKDSYTISFNPNLGTGSMNDVLAKYEEEYVLPSCGFTAPAGKKFDCWYANNTEYAVGDTVIIKKDTEFVASWTDDVFAVSFDANGGTGEMASVSDALATYNLPACEFTAPAGKQFVGWAVGDVDATPIASGMNVNLTEDTTLYAIWDDNESFAISYNDYHGTLVTFSLPEGSNFSVATFEELGFIAPAGKSFSHWKERWTHTDNIAPGSNYVVPDDDILFDAVYVETGETVCTITFDANGQSGSMESVEVVADTVFTFPKPEFTAPSGTLFAGWSFNGDITKVYQPFEKIVVTENVDLGAMWRTPIGVEAEYNGRVVKGGSLNAKNIVIHLVYDDDYREPILPSSVSFSAGGTPIADIESYVFDNLGTKDITVSYAGYDDATMSVLVVNEYHVSFLTNGGKGTMEPVVTNSASYTLPSNGFASPDHGEFRCWLIDDTEYAPGDVVTLTGDTIVKAVWDAIYTVSFNANGGSGEMVSAQQKAGEFTLPGCSLQAPAGKELAGWKINNEGELLDSGEKIAVSDNVVLYAQWVDVALVSIAVSGDYKTEYTTADVFSSVGIVVTATYSDSSQEAVDLKDVQFSGYDLSVPGAQTVTVTYEGKSTTFGINVTVPEKTLQSIYISGNYNDHYTVGDEFSSEGIIVTAVYSDTSEENVDLASVAFSGYDMSQTGEQTVTVTYEGKTTTFTIIVEAAPEQSSEPIDSSEPTSSEPIGTSEQSSEPSSEPVVSSSPMTTSEPTSSEQIVSSEPTSSQEPVSSDSQAVSSETPASSSEAPAEDKGGLGGGAVAGIVVGSVAVAGIGGFSVVWFGVKKKSFADLLKIFKRK